VWQHATNAATAGSITESQDGIHNLPEFLTLGSYLRAWEGSRLFIRSQQAADAKALDAVCSDCFYGDM
jgi:hypothetical protein